MLFPKVFSERVIMNPFFMEQKWLQSLVRFRNLADIRAALNGTYEFLASDWHGCAVVVGAGALGQQLLCGPVMAVCIYWVFTIRTIPCGARLLVARPCGL